MNINEVNFEEARVDAIDALLDSKSFYLVTVSDDEEGTRLREFRNFNCPLLDAIDMGVRIKDASDFLIKKINHTVTDTVQRRNNSNN